MANTPYVTTGTANFQVPGPVDVALSATDYLGFYGATPVVQRASAVQVAFADTLVSGGFGFSDKAHGDALIATFNEIVATLTGLGLWKGGAA